MSSLYKNRNVVKVEEKPKIAFIKPVDESIKSKLYGIANKGYGATQPKIITIDEIKKAINEWKLENQIYSQEISLSTCTEISLNFQKILQIANLENLVKLEKLKLDNNLIMKIENLDALVNIKWLDLSFNYITLIEGLNNLVNLEDLSLYNNQITDVGGLDNCRKLNVLSIGKNNITNPKGMVTYLRKFSNLQALNVHDNPFCKEDIAGQFSLENQMQQKNIYYPSSYDPILANLEKLKYLDWKPIDEEKREIAFQNYKNNQQKDQNDIFIQDEEKQQKLSKAYQDLKHANAEAVIDFYQQVERKFQSDVSSGWERFKKLPGLDDKLRLMEKLIDDVLTPFKNDILEKQEEKDFAIRKRNKEINLCHEKFVDMSKNLVSNFKREFKKKTLNIKAEHIEKDKINLEIKLLADKLYEIEVYEKQAMIVILKGVQADLKTIDSNMNDKTNDLKEKLEAIKKTFKTHITQLKEDLESKFHPYEKPEDIPEDLRELNEMINDADVLSDFEKLTDSYDDKKETLDNARNLATTKFLDNLNDQEYTRNKKRLEDINQIVEMYSQKLKTSLESDCKKY